MIVHVAGTARDCAEGLLKRLTELQEVLEFRLGLSVYWHFFENDSKDDTRPELITFCAGRANATLLFEDGLAQRIPPREARLAFCRNSLLESVIAAEGINESTRQSSIYLPLDLDLEIEWRAIADELRSAIALVFKGICTGVFPSSSPNYYDIHALRALNWNEEDAWLALNRAKSRSPNASRMHLRQEYITSRQLSADDLASQGRLVWVRSAFGGFGIYDLSTIRGQSYESRSEDTCEHVAFNIDLERLAILTSMRIPAPIEHLETVMSHIGPSRRLACAVRSAYARSRNLLRRLRSRMTKNQTSAK